MIFVRTAEGRLINLRHVVELAATRGGATAVMVDGTRVRLKADLHEIEADIEDAAARVVPARDGYEVLFFHCATADAASLGLVTREPVLAWRISGEAAFPVTLEPYMSSPFIKRPNGIVSDVQDQDWDSEREWLDAMRTKHNEMRAKREATNGSSPVRQLKPQGVEGPMPEKQ